MDEKKSNGLNKSCVVYSFDFKLNICLSFWNRILLSLRLLKTDHIWYIIWYYNIIYITLHYLLWFDMDYIILHMITLLDTHKWVFFNLHLYCINNFCGYKNITSVKKLNLLLLQLWHILIKYTHERYKFT